MTALERTLAGQFIGGLIVGGLMGVSTDPKDFVYPWLVMFFVVMVGALIGGQIGSSITQDKSK